MLRFAKITLALAFISSMFAAGAYAENSAIKSKKSPLAWSQRAAKKNPSQNVKAAVKRFNESNGNKWKVRYNPMTGSPESLMEGRSSKRYSGRKPSEQARSFLKENSEMLNINTDNLKESGETSFFGMKHVRYQQYYKGLPVEFTYTKVHMEENGTVTGYQSSYDPTIDIDINPSVSAAQALQAAGADAGSTIKMSTHTLVIFPDNLNGTAYLAWKIRGRSYDGKHIWVYYINAKNAEVLFRYDDMRRFCSGSNVKASSKAGVYEISPVPEKKFPYYSYPSTYWQTSINGTLSPAGLSLNPLSDQYIWIKDNNTRMVTDKNGIAVSSAAYQYEESNGWVTDSTVGCSVGQASGKIFSAFKGPYFTVSSMRGQSAHWDNGGGTVQRGYFDIISAMPYSNSSNVPWTRYLSPTLGSNTFAKQYPVFEAPFSVGEMDDYGNVSNLDEVFVEDTDGNVFGSYIGRRSQSFRGASVESTTFTVRLISDDSSVGTGFAIRGSDYIVLTDDPGTALAESYNAIDWSTGTIAAHNSAYEEGTGTGLGLLVSTIGANGTFGIDEPNVFYHLNKMRRYFMQFNKLNSNLCPIGSTCYRTPVDLDKHLNVMVHANGNQENMYDGSTYRNGMENAFFDLELGNIMIGDGGYDGVTPSFAYRSFALDGTIVRHEYTHFVVHQIYDIINFGEFGAISEALSDYFSLASLWDEGEKGEGRDSDGNYSSSIVSLKQNVTKVGNFVMSPRDLSLTDKILPGSWTGELYNDSQILSQALYSLRKGFRSPIGGSNYADIYPWGNVPVADLVVFASLFYFPDSFRGFYEAMRDSCGRLNNILSGSCDVEKIDQAFGDHGLIFGGSVSSGDDYESVNGGLCQNNNGPECAADITNIRSLEATVYPAGDLDYYTFTADAGTMIAQLKLPENNNYNFHGYMLALYDESRNFLAEEIPVLVTSAEDNTCSYDDPCTALQQYVTLTYNLPKSGRYYLLVSAAPSIYEDGYGISPEHSTDPYTLTTKFLEQGNVKAEISRAESSYDNDYIAFYAPALVTSSFTNDIIQESTQTYSSDLSIAVENYFSHVQLWDVLGHKLDQASTNYIPEANRLVQLDGETTITNEALISGKIRIQEGFSRRYPSVASVIVEVIGYNRMGNLVSLGKSAPVNLTSNNSSRLEAYNNILLKGQGTALIRFAVTGKGRLTIKAYTQTGKLVKVIADRTVEAGEQGNEKWDGTNDKGSKVASGIYFIKAEGPGLDKVEKVAVIR